MACHDPAANYSIHLAGHAPMLNTVIALPQVQMPLQSTGLLSDDMQVVLQNHWLYDKQQLCCSLNMQAREAGMPDALCDAVADEELSQVVHHGRHLCRHLHIRNR